MNNKKSAYSKKKNSFVTFMYPGKVLLIRPQQHPLSVIELSTIKMSLFNILCRHYPMFCFSLQHPDPQIIHLLIQQAQGALLWSPSKLSPHGEAPLRDNKCGIQLTKAHLDLCYRSIT